MAFKYGKSLAVAVASVLVLAACTNAQENIKKLTKEAEAGNVESMVKIGEMYCGGTNVTQDDQICGMWMKRAAEKGHKRAQYVVGRMYELGLGMRADPVQAYKWYSVSASQEYHMADAGAKKVWDTMTLAQRDQAKQAVAEQLAKQQ